MESVEPKLLARVPLQPENTIPNGSMEVPSTTSAFNVFQPLKHS